MKKKEGPPEGFVLREFSRSKEWERKESRHKIVRRSNKGRRDEWSALYRYKENKAGKRMAWRVTYCGYSKQEDERWNRSSPGRALLNNSIVRRSSVRGKNHRTWFFEIYSNSVEDLEYWNLKCVIVPTINLHWNLPVFLRKYKSRSSRNKIMGLPWDLE